MIRVIRRLRLWGGHLLLAPVAVALLATLLFARDALRADTPETSWFYFLLSVAMFFLTIIFGILSAATFNTYRERYHLRAMWAADDAKAPGVYRSGRKARSPQDEAHSAGKEVSSA